MNPEEAERIRTKQRQIEISLNNTYSKPLAEVLNYEAQLKKMPTAIDLTTDQPSWNNLLVSTQAGIHTKPDLSRSLLKIADPSSATIIESTLRTKLTPDKITYLTANWSLIEREIRKRLTHGSSPADVVSSILQVMNKDTASGPYANPSPNNAPTTTTPRQTNSVAITVKQLSTDIKNMTFNDAKTHLKKHNYEVTNAGDVTNPEGKIIRTLTPIMKVKIQNEAGSSHSTLDDSVKHDLTDSQSTTGYGLKKSKSKRVYKKPIKFRHLCGTGSATLASNDVQTSEQGKYYRLNKFMIDGKSLQENKIVLKYCSNRNIHGEIPKQNCSDDVKQLVFQLCHGEFDKQQFDKLNSKDKKFLTHFADACHLDIGIDFADDIKAQYEIILAEYRAGNASAKPKLLEFIGDCIRNKSLSIKKGLEIMKRIA